MENTSRINISESKTFTNMKTKVTEGIILILLTFLLSHAPVMGETFPAAIAFVAYMVSRNTMYIYLAIPSAAGIFLCIGRGCDAWGELIAMCICAVLSAAARNIKLELWQRGIVASASAVTCVSIYRLVTSSVYKTSMEMLMLEGLLVFVYIFIFAAVMEVIEKKSGGEAALAGLVSTVLLIVCGMGMGFFIWPVIVFLTICVTVYSDMGSSAMVIAASGIYAALINETQWGLMITLIISSFAASFFRKFGAAAVTAVFVFVCVVLKSVESGVVLGSDNYCLILAALSFAVLNWKFRRKMKKVIAMFSFKAASEAEEKAENIENVLKMQAWEMKELAELYSTYVDSRSMLSTQFSITKQIIEETRRKTKEELKSSVHLVSEKFDTEVAAAQCAAAGEINGDCCGWQDISDGRSVLVISDGMGKGKKAATESLMVTRTIIGLLKSGVSTDLTLKMINTIMVMKDDEDSYATVDLVVLDRKTGKAKFYKIGAAPTLIKRKNKIEEVKLSAVPLGIVNGLKIRYVDVFLKKGDCIIMMSDGVSDGGNGRGALQDIKEIALKIRSENPQSICDLILNRSLDSYLGRERDDLTVLVAKLM